MSHFSTLTFLWAKHLNYRKYEIKHFTNIGDMQHQLFRKIVMRINAFIQSNIYWTSSILSETIFHTWHIAINKDTNLLNSGEDKSI